MDLSPRQIVNELNKHIIGQDEAKKAVAIALRNRYRRSQLSKELRDEITPKNIIMKGPTGVGKTEIARRLAKLVKAPFIKVEATKYTEVGYVGKDVEGMVRDLVECAVRLVKDEKTAEVSVKATETAEQKMVKILAEVKKNDRGETAREVFEQNLLDSLRKGTFDKLVVETEVKDEPKNMELVPGGAAINLGSIFGEMLPQRKKKRKLTVSEAMKLFIAEESDKLIDNDAVTDEALRRAENDGIIFIDEIDKIAAKGNTGGADVSREGVQRDILPIVEGSTVMTKYGPVKTDYMLFIAAGAFHVARVEDLIPELQGRFPLRVELAPLGKNEFLRILQEPTNALTKQYSALLGTEGVRLSFSEDGLEEIATFAEEINTATEDIGARRLYTIMEKVLADISFDAPEMPGAQIMVNKDYVREHLTDVREDQDLSQYIL